MASDKKTKAAPKAEPAAKKDTAAKKETSAVLETKVEPKDAGADLTKAEEKVSDKPSNYSRGEGQKAVTQAYKDNWDAIFAKKKKR